MIELPAEFIQRMSKIAGFKEFLKSYEKPPVRAIRVNTLKISVEDFKKISPFELEQVPWEKNGFYVNGEGLGKTILHAAGLYYVQEPSAMCAAPKLDVKRGERVLDLCSAPGGKGTQLAQAMDGDGVLVLNEIDYKRCGILASNVERLGIKNAIITCKSPKNLAQSAEEYFDKILVDAPCSGEGMFKKEVNAIPEWSLQNVKLCTERQEKILDSAAVMLAGGGRLVYSTCTFAPEEDEGQIENFLKMHKNFRLISMDKLLPHEVCGEGHFCAVLEKCDGDRRALNAFTGTAIVNKAADRCFRDWAKDVLNVEFGNLFQTGDRGNVHIYSIPDEMPSLGYGVVRSGVCLATVNAVNGKVEPAHALAMCLKSDEVKHIEVDEATALKYLRGLTFDCAESEKGWRVVTFMGYPLGWCKAVAGVAKNHLPKGLRI